MAEKKAINIYQMYTLNGDKCGFWVRRNSWGRHIARITRIANQFEGALEGKPPYFDNPKVKGDMYFSGGGLSGKNQEITCAGTYGYELIDTPSWWSDDE